MAGLKELIPGSKFDQLGSWYRVINDIIERTDKIALAHCCDDDGLVQYVIFENQYDGLWHSCMSSPYLEGMRHHFDLKKNYVYTQEDL